MYTRQKELILQANSSSERELWCLSGNFSIFVREKAAKTSIVNSLEDVATALNRTESGDWPAIYCIFTFCCISNCYCMANRD